MKALKITGFIILAIIIVLLVVSFFLPKHIHIERSVFIKAPAEVVFNQINVLKNWEEWSPWHQIDTTMLITYTGPEGGIGSAYEWESDNPKAGKGKLTIIKSHPYDTIATEMDFFEKGKAEGAFALNKSDSGVTVTWYMNETLSHNPFHKYIGLVMDKMIGGDFEKGLNNLKQIAESMPVPGYVVEEVRLTSSFYVSIFETCTQQDITAILGKDYGELMAFIVKNKLNMTGPPFSIYYSIENDQFEMDIAIPVDKKGKDEGRVKFGEIQEGNALKVVYTGSYGKISPVYDHLNKYVSTNNKIIRGAPWEVYITDPGENPDTSKWITHIYFPIK